MHLVSESLLKWVNFLSLLTARKHTKQDSNLNEEWKSMFGSLDPPSLAQTPSTVPNVLVPSGGGEPNGTLARERLRSGSSSQTLNLPHVPSSAQVDRWADSVLSSLLCSFSALSYQPFSISLFSVCICPCCSFVVWKGFESYQWSDIFSHVCTNMQECAVFYQIKYVTLDHKTSLKLLGCIFCNSQTYIAWVKIIHFSFMPKITRILSEDHVPWRYCQFLTVNI